MNRDQLNRTGMFGAVSAYMATNKNLWQSIKAVGDAITDLDEAIATIMDAAGKQQTPVTGAASAKAQVRHDFEDQILLISDQVAAMAEATNDPSIDGQVELTLSALDKMADDVLEETGNRIATLATANITALADYGITQQEVTDLKNLGTQFHAIKTAPRTAVAGRAGQTATLPDLIADATSILRNRLDKLMTQFRRSNPDFYAGYQSARVVVDRGGSAADDQPAPAPANVPQK